MKNAIKYFALCLLVITTAAGCDNSVKSEDYSGKKYSADLPKDEYGDYRYFEFNFINDSKCTFFSNVYDRKDDKYYSYEEDIQNYVYRYYIDKKHLVLVKTAINGADTMRLEISDNNLVWNHEGYPQFAELPPITLTKN